MTQASPPSRMLLLVVCSLLTLLSACTGRGGSEVGPVARAYDPQAFPDVPVPPGYAPTASGEHLAVSYAGGDIRRYLATYRQVLADAVTGDALGEWYGRRLRSTGWRLGEDRWPRAQIWRKGDERLLVETGRDGEHTIIRLTLAPAEA